MESQNNWLLLLTSKDQKPIHIQVPKLSFEEKTLDGVDIFVCQDNRDPEALATQLKKVSEGNEVLELTYITNRGIKVYPDPNSETFCTDHWRCRFFKKTEESQPSSMDIVSLLQILASTKVEVIKTENLYSFDGEKNYSQIE